ncbi:MAG: hypothetical protein ABR509_06545 [Candidatus Limnocylindria bacterium]
MRGPIAPAAIVGLAALLALPTLVAGAEPETPKVAIIVGPVGDLTPTYLELAEQAADAAFESGALVARAYSPDATAENVLEAVRDANIVVYLGHGSGYRDDFAGVNPAVANGWGLQGPRAHGTHEDSWVNGTLGYYGEKWIAEHARPAPGFVMIYSNACYAPGAGEGIPGPAAPRDAARRAGYYSRGMLEMGASAYYATDFYAGAARLIETILTNPTTSYGDIFRADPYFPFGSLQVERHPFVADRQLWLHRSRYFDGQLNYWYAFAGDPDATPAGSGVDSRRLEFDPQRALSFSGGTYTGYQFDSSGNVVRTRTAHVSSDSQAPTVIRTRIPGRDGYWFGVTRGIWAGYYVRESADIHLPGIALETTLRPMRPVTFSPGEHIGYRFTRGGTVADAKPYELGARSTAHATARAVINGERYLFITDGVWEGYWIRESDDVRLQPLPAPSLPPASAIQAMREAIDSLPEEIADEIAAGLKADLAAGDITTYTVAGVSRMTNDAATAVGATTSPSSDATSTRSSSADPSPTPTPTAADGATAEPTPTTAASPEPTPTPSTEPTPTPSTEPTPTPNTEPSPTTPTPTPTPTPGV